MNLYELYSQYENHIMVFLYQTTSFGTLEQAGRVVWILLKATINWGAKKMYDV